MGDSFLKTLIDSGPKPLTEMLSVGWLAREGAGLDGKWWSVTSVLFIYCIIEVL